MSKPKPFNNPFGALKISKAPEPTAPPGKGPPLPARPKARSAQDSKPLREDEETRLFLESVGEVAPVRRAKPRAPQTAEETRRLASTPTEDDDVLAELTALTAGDAPLERLVKNGRAAGQVPGLDEKLLQRLGQGQYAVQAHVDLHGLPPSAEKARLEKFLVESRHGKLRCVTVASDRPDGLPALLSQGRTGRQVLAFTASEDGEPFSVLLRR